MNENNRIRNEREFRKAQRETVILRPPKHLLSTFGETVLQYYLVCAPEKPSPFSRLREGELIAERPQILTPGTLRSQFEGFGPETREYAEWFLENYGEDLRSVAYRFRHRFHRDFLHPLPWQTLAERTEKLLQKQDSARTILLKGPDLLWGFSLMKCIVEITLKSFWTNVREMEERGFFEPGGPERHRQKKDITDLFKKAQRDPAALRELGRKLNDYGLFREYEDRFFALIKQRA